jgi:hypothetical protein|tara:strand:+ start:2090 stop:3550 length:1461 start_codon:yes stop_codon:yes gene_type:complete
MSTFNLKNSKPLGKGQTVENDGIAAPEVLSKLKGYRKTVVAGYRPLLLDEIGSNLTSGEMYISPKIDGELWFMIIEDDEVVLSNTRGKLIAGDIPLISEVSQISKRFKGRVILVGELFVASKKSRPRVSDLASALGGGAKAEVEKLGFAAFDIISGGDVKSSIPLVDYKDRLALIQRLLADGKRAKCVKTETINSPGEVINYFNNWVDAGKAEGLVIRAGEGRIYKVKPSLSIDAVIIGYTEKSGDSSQVRSIILALMRADDTFQLLGSCGSLGDEKARKEMMQKIQKSQVKSNWRHTSGDGAIYHFVKPEVIVEIKVVDVQGEDSSGDSIRKMVLSIKDNEWVALQKLPCASVHHPVFIRYRSDKQVNALDLRIEQISDRCLINNKETKAEVITLPSSEIVRREVYSKTIKEITSVRKLVILKTNKEEVDSDFPAYVVHWTDFSPDRKEPLKREVRLASVKETATTIAEEMLEKNIKKGWEKVQV